MVKNLLQCREPGFDPWAGKIPWKRKWEPTPIFLPGKSHRQRSLEGYSPWGSQRVGHNLANLVTKQQQNTGAEGSMTCPKTHTTSRYRAGVRLELRFLSSNSNFRGCKMKTDKITCLVHLGYQLLISSFVNLINKYVFIGLCSAGTMNRR